MVKRAFIAVAVGGLIAITVLVMALTGGEQSSPAEPVDAAFEYFDGTAGSLAELRGTPVVVNFWASWCPACVAEMPDFEEIHQHFGDRVVFVGMNTQEFDLAAAEALVEQTGVTYRLAHDPQGLIYQQFGGIAMPTSLFIDEDGQLVEIHSGTLFADQLREKIETVLLSS